MQNSQKSDGRIPCSSRNKIGPSKWTKFWRSTVSRIYNIWLFCIDLLNPFFSIFEYNIPLSLPKFL